VEDGSIERFRVRLVGHLRLLRLPLIATTIADVWSGYFGAGATGPLLFTHGAAAAFYGAGMTLNDAFDAEVDRAKAPERPIPSGAISARAAFLQGMALLAAGIALAALGGPGRLAAGGALAAAILLYDGLLKRHAIPGALAMGACRYLDVQLGAGFAAGAAFPPALALGAYVAAITWRSTFEDRPGRDRAREKRKTRLSLLGIFAVDGAALAALGHTALGAAAAALAASVPLAGWLQRAATARPRAGRAASV
jgi:4-hydroxybenzoate polyprenyltransferase